MGAVALRDQPLAHPLGRQEKRALVAVLAAGAVAIMPVLRLLPDLLRDDSAAEAKRSNRKLAEQ